MYDAALRQHFRYIKFIIHIVAKWQAYTWLDAPSGIGQINTQVGVDLIHAKSLVEKINSMFYVYCTYCPYQLRVMQYTFDV